MGTGESGTPTKTTKASIAQDQPPVAPASYVEWAAAFQAYYNGATPPPGYFPPGVAPAQPLPYMWAGQHVLPPYRAAPPFAAMYPPGHLYGHPSMPQGPYPYPFGMTPAGGAMEATTATATTDQGNCKSSDGKEQSPAKRSKGSVGSPGRPGNKGQDGNKSTPTSMNGVLSQSAESGSDGSSDGSEEDNRHDMLEKRSYEKPLEGVSAVKTVNTALNQTAAPSNPVAGRPAALPPAANLNVGLDYWNAAPPGAVTVGKGKRNPAVTQALVPNFQNNPLLGVGSQEGATSECWLQDERELKRQRRKQSNRESARRSRLRKQAECEELATRVDTLAVENMALCSEINRLVEERNKLSSENNALLEQLKKKDHDDGTGEGSQMREIKENSLTSCPMTDIGKARDAFDAESLRSQALRHSRDEPGKSVELVSIGLDIGGHSAAVTAN